MLSNPFKKFVQPRLPRAAIGLTEKEIAIVLLERRRGAYAIQRAGQVDLPRSLVRPGFDTTNVADPSELADILAELAASVGLGKRKRWSVALPEAATRTVIVSLDGEPSARTELEEMLRWKIERAIGAPLDELQIAQQRLRATSGGARERYLVSSIRRGVLSEYEGVFARLGWHVGLVLPRSVSEAWWLMKGSPAQDALLISSATEGFTAMVMRNGEPLVVRSILCDQAADCTDELYRLLLFYRDRLAKTVDDDGPGQIIERLLVAGDKLQTREANRILAEIFDAAPRIINAEDVQVIMPTSDFNFATLAAPAALASLAWN